MKSAIPREQNYAAWLVKKKLLKPQKSSEKNLLKPLKITIFQPNLWKTGSPMGHAQNIFFLSKITNPDPKLSEPFYFNKVLYVLAELWMFFYIV